MFLQRCFLLIRKAQMYLGDILIDAKKVFSNNNDQVLRKQLT